MADARLFAEELRATSRSEVIYVELRGAQHAFDVFGSPRTRRMVVAAERFLFAVHDAYLHRPESPLAPPADTSAPTGEAGADTDDAATPSRELAL